MTLAPVGHGGDGIRIWRQRRTRNPKGLEVARLIVAWQAPTNPPALLCMFAPARACGSRPGRRIFAISRQPQESSERPSRGGPGGGASVVRPPVSRLLWRYLGGSPLHHWI